MSTDLTIGYLAADGSFAVVAGSELIARCSTQAKAERIIAALSAADELAACREALQEITGVAENFLKYAGAIEWRGVHQGPLRLYDLENSTARAKRALRAKSRLAAASPTTADGGSDAESDVRLIPPWRARGTVQVRLTNRGRLPFHGPDDPDPEQTVTDLVDLIHEHGSDELIAMADALLDVPNSAENAHSNI